MRPEPGTEHRLETRARAPRHRAQRPARQVVPGPERLQRRSPPRADDDDVEYQARAADDRADDDETADQRAIARADRREQQRAQHGGRHEQLRVRHTQPDREQHPEGAQVPALARDVDGQRQRGEHQERFRAVLLELLAVLDRGRIERDEKHRERAAERVAAEPAPELPREPQRREAERERQEPQRHLGIRQPRERQQEERPERGRARDCDEELPDALHPRRQRDPRLVVPEAPAAELVQAISGSDGRSRRSDGDREPLAGHLGYPLDSDASSRSRTVRSSSRSLAYGTTVSAASMRDPAHLVELVVAVADPPAGTPHQVVAHALADAHRVLRPGALRELVARRRRARTRSRPRRRSPRAPRGGPPRRASRRPRRGPSGAPR